MFLAIINFIYTILIHSFDFILFLSHVAHTVLPLGLDVGIAGAAAYMFLRLRPPSPDSVKRIFGPDPWSKEGQQQPEALVQCIAHRGAGLDAPENTLEAFKYVSFWFDRF